MKDEAFDELSTSVRQAGRIRRGAAKAARRVSYRGYRPADVKAIRAKLGQSQAEFARMIGVSVATLRNWEQGLRVPLLSAAYRLARALGVTLDALAGRAFEEPPGSGAAGEVPGVAREATSGGAAAPRPPRQKKAAGGKGRKGKGRK